MRITNGAGLPAINEAPGAQIAEGPAVVPRSASAVRPAGDAATLRLSHAEMQKLPDVDSQRVADIKAALLNGTIVFDANSLAARIARYHGGPQ